MDNKRPKKKILAFNFKEEMEKTPIEGSYDPESEVWTGDAKAGAAALTYTSTNTRSGTRTQHSAFTSTTTINPFGGLDPDLDYVIASDLDFDLDQDNDNDVFY